MLLLLLLLLSGLQAAQVLEVMHKSVLPKDIKMPTATLNPSTLISRCGGGNQSAVPLELNLELHTLARTATADCSSSIKLANLRSIIWPAQFLPLTYRGELGVVLKMYL